MKKALIITLCAALLAMSCPVMAYTSNSPSVYVNGSLVKLDAEPDTYYYYNMWTLPLSGMWKALNFSLNTYTEDETFVIAYGNMNILLRMGSRYAYVFDGGTVSMKTLSIAPYLKGTETMVPDEVFALGPNDVVTHNTNTYAIDIRSQGLSVRQDQNSAAANNKIPILGVTAKYIPEKENYPILAFDGDLSTRYASTDFDAVFDLGSVRQVDAVDLAFWFNEVRLEKYRLSVNEDGVNYVEIFNGESTLGNTWETVDVHQNARYIRVEGFGNSDNLWTSLLEIVVRGW